MITNVFMRLVNALEKGRGPEKWVNLGGCPAPGHPRGFQQSVERHPFDMESGGLELGDHILDRLGVFRLAFDLDHRVFGR